MSPGRRAWRSVEEFAPENLADASGYNAAISILGPSFACLVFLHLFKAAVFVAAGQPPLHMDSMAYWQMARACCRATGWLLPRHRRSPARRVIPLFLAVFQALGGTHAMAATLVFQELSVVVTAHRGGLDLRELRGRGRAF